jgi:hypothetical protein
MHLKEIAAKREVGTPHWIRPSGRLRVPIVSMPLAMKNEHVVPMLGDPFVVLFEQLLGV